MQEKLHGRKWALTDDIDVTVFSNGDVYLDTYDAKTHMKRIHSDKTDVYHFAKVTNAIASFLKEFDENQNYIPKHGKEEHEPDAV